MISETISHYRIVEKLGAGGMGEVYLARDMKLGRNVALKLLSHRLASDSDALERLENEAKVLASLNHPGIVTIYSVDRFDGQPFLAMELVEGQNLGALIPEGGLSFEDFLALAVPVADALGAAHEKSITHRDLKPANIMVTDTKRVKVLDFGLAKLHDASPDVDPDAATEELDSHEQVIGTPQYMSPEQLRGSAVDPRSDVFSLGVVFYEMLAGHRPWRGTVLAETIASILKDDPPSLTRINSHVPARLARLVDRCLEKDPALRPNSGIELRDELVRIKTVKGLTEPEPRLSIAVLPFADMSAEQDQAYFCEGMAEELINALTHIEDLQVASRTSSFLYKNSSADIREIGRRLNVSSILEGSVRKAGDTLRITAQLINVSNGYHLWSNHYDRQLADVFAIQDEISQSITQALQVTLTSGEKYSLHASHTTNVDAYDYYLRGRKAFFEQRRKAIELSLQMYSLAIKHDPDYALAFAGIADCHSYLYMIGEPTQEHLEMADAASHRALQLSPDLAEAYVSRGFALSAAKRHAEAEVAFKTAIRLNSNLFDAYYFYGRDAFARGDFEKAAAMFELASGVSPEDFQAPLLAAQVYTSLGREAEAMAARRQGVQIVERILKLNPGDVRALYLGANGLAVLGQREKALEWAALAVSMDPEESMVLYNVACIYARAGEIEDSMDCLERAVEAGLTLKGWIVNDSDLDAVRDHPRYEKLLKSLDAASGK